jgi:hypothetical protein
MFQATSSFDPNFIVLLMFGNISSSSSSSSSNPPEPALPYGWIFMSLPPLPEAVAPQAQQKVDPDHEEKVTMPLPPRLILHSSPHRVLVAQVENIMLIMGCNRATATHALLKSRGDAQAALNKFCEEEVTPQADGQSSSGGGGGAAAAATGGGAGGGAALPARRGYYANVITGKTSLTPPTTVPNACAEHKPLSEITTEEIAKSIRETGSEYKKFAEQIVGYGVGFDCVTFDVCQLFS